jgi:hypothetical protein
MAPTTKRASNQEVTEIIAEMSFQHSSANKNNSHKYVKTTFEHTSEIRCRLRAPSQQRPENNKKHIKQHGNIIPEHACPSNSASARLYQRPNN